MQTFKLILLALFLFASPSAFSMSELEGMFENGDATAFMVRATELAEQGDAEALFLMGKAYYHLGKGGVDVDLAKAERYYQEADRRGSARAGNNLGNIYLQRMKTDEAIVLYKKSLERGLKMPTLRNLARAHDISSEEIAEGFPRVELLKRAKLAGDYYAQAYAETPSADLASNAGRCYLWVYLRGRVSREYFNEGGAEAAAKSLAFEWLQKAMDAGDPVAWTNYGSVMRDQGRSDDAWAAFKRGAAGDIPLANYYLGVMLDEGFAPDGMKLNYKERDDLALSYFEKAAARQMGQAIGSARRLLIQKYGNERDEQKLSEGISRLEKTNSEQRPLSYLREYRDMVERLRWIREARESRAAAKAMLGDRNGLVSLKACGLGENDEHNKAYGFNYGPGFRFQWELVYYRKAGEPISTGLRGDVGKDGCAVSSRLPAVAVKALRAGAWFGLVVPNSVLALQAQPDGAKSAKLVLAPVERARGELR